MSDWEPCIIINVEVLSNGLLWVHGEILTINYNILGGSRVQELYIVYLSGYDNGIKRIVYEVYFVVRL